ncbi:FAD-binding and (Fe-S)-binding domain-containing protein [Lyngbya confervoides]|uniref:D-2-hydroxyglutarate dehydrogenase n=1 Tax=Lyngbya confervoides BDU141951 TaxID=1574623 RepID=A0ABD4T6Z9_9CYAN|nr:FAD-binding and (Fe-S)-binding domain-containing protein [Lyngbya confervoides]MCM1984489.1 FAD-binding oxidoreductase [Lyngbya confervoides BDU141951]
MIPRLSPQPGLCSQTAEFLQALRKTAFRGEIRGDFASRLLCATDNSIYQILPQAVIYPRSRADVVQTLRLAQQFPEITFTPRGGGTGTNGQSLSPGIVLDCSKYMRQILEINAEEAWVRVQPGVVLDQLNEALQPYGLFFAPALAPSNRATLGGMINTDACGQGSRLYGRTSDHVLALEWVLPEGTQGRSMPVNPQDLQHLKDQPGPLGRIYRQVDHIVTQRRELIAQTFPKMPRFMTGYNLAKVYNAADQTFDLNRILAGSEGTLAVITEAKLRLLKIPQYKCLAVVHYRCFDEALQGARPLLTLNPAAIETVDEKILDLARQDGVYPAVQEFIGAASCFNLVELREISLAQMQAKLGALDQQLRSEAIPYTLAHTDAEMNQLWALRKKGVGLLGNQPGDRKPIPFVEDTAVPPDRLYDYIQEFKALLNEAGLDYAMFGHVDVGCIHVRPALDTKDPADVDRIRQLSDQVVALVRRYGGVMWGEHGKGFRSEYTPQFFGDVLYQDLRRIKAAFDPENRLNPGKIVTPYGSDAAVVTLEAPLKGSFDRQVPEPWRSQYPQAFSCNGNGACFNVLSQDVMCPSYKGMAVDEGGGDRIHSPKGRATLLREWLRQLAQQEARPDSWILRCWNTLQKQWGVEDYSHEVYAGLHGCLSCKACASQCPVHVDIPSLKSKFLEQYHSRYLRPPRDYLVAYLEEIAALQAQFPRISNWAMQHPLARWGAKQLLGMVDYPALSQPGLAQGLAARNAPPFDRAALAQQTGTSRHKSVVLLLDTFTAVYDAPLVLDTYDLLQYLGYQVYISPPLVSGKLYHLKGFMARFRTIAQRNLQTLEAMADLGLPIVGIEPSLVLTYRDEYQSLFPSKSVQILLIQEFLSQDLDLIRAWFRGSDQVPSLLWSHCTEQSTLWNAGQQWQIIFQAAGVPLTLVKSGCCGMAGVYGHEAEHYPLSQRIFKAGWQPQLPTDPEAQKQVLVTGYSCRSQIQRFAGWRPRHPVQGLYALHKAESSG